MLDRPVSLNEAEAMLDARLDRATALRFREILAAWPQAPASEPSSPPGSPPPPHSPSSTGAADRSSKAT